MKENDDGYQCFLATPFGGEFGRIRERVAEALLEMNVTPVLVEEFASSSQRISEVSLHAIKSADFVLVDLTNNNPNVIFELGYAQASEVPLLVLAQKHAREVPFDVASFLYITYDPSDLDDLVRSVRIWTKRIIEQIKSERGAK